MVGMNDVGVVGVLVNALHYAVFVMGTSFQQMTCLLEILNVQENEMLLMNILSFCHYTT